MRIRKLSPTTKNVLLWLAITAAITALASALSAAEPVYEWKPSHDGHGQQFLWRNGKQIALWSEHDGKLWPLVPGKPGEPDHPGEAIAWDGMPGSMIYRAEDGSFTATARRQAAADGATEALDEVNAARAARGLRPYVRDEGLTQGALNLARYRADRLIEGHTGNDFSRLPVGCSASAGGCAAWHGNDWGSCCTYERWTYGGAAWARGRDGRRYMYLFVR